MTTAEASVLRKALYVVVADGKEVSATGLGAYYEPRTLNLLGQIACNSTTANTHVVRMFPSAEHVLGGLLQRLDSYPWSFYQGQRPIPPCDVDLLSGRTLLLDWEESFPIREDIKGGSVENMPTLSNPRQNPEAEIEEFFHTLQEQNFDEVGEDDFLKALTFFIKQYGEEAIAAIARLVLSGGISEEIASETLRQLGYLEHSPTYQRRLELFEQGLSSESAQVRYTAALGLASLDDPEAILYLKQAIEREKYADLRKVFVRVLEQLENAR